jgi:hypothetical protein
MKNKKAAEAIQVNIDHCKGWLKQNKDAYQSDIQKAEKKGFLRGLKRALSLVKGE